MNVLRSPARALLATAVTVAALGATTLPARAQGLVVYDNFATGLAPSRWIGTEARQFGAIPAEVSRGVVSGQLRLQDKIFGDNASDVGTSTGRNGVQFARNGLNITTMRATVTMRSIGAGTCPANPTPGANRARLFGFFFNAGTPQPFNNYNDVYAGIQLQRLSNSSDAAGVLHVIGFVGICTDDSCINTTTLSTLDLGLAAVGTPVALQVGWNKASHLFSFQKDLEAAQTIPYTYDDAQAPAFPGKRIEVYNVAPHCTASRVPVNTTADFDGVMTN